MGETVQSLDDFLRVLRKSDLVPVEQLAKAIEPWKGTEGPVPSGLLEVLVDEKLLTAWQIEQLQKGIENAADSVLGSEAESLRRAPVRPVKESSVFSGELPVTAP